VELRNSGRVVVISFIATLFQINFLPRLPVTFYSYKFGADDDLLPGWTTLAGVRFDG
jgi:hypothetical protein